VTVPDYLIEAQISWEPDLWGRISRAVEGGTDGFLSNEATTAKRAEIAAMLRKQAAELADPANPVPEMLRLAESLVYERNEEAFERGERLANQYMTSLQQLPADKLAAKKDEVRHLRDVCKYMVKFNLMPGDFEPKAQLEQLIKAQQWDKK